MTVIFNTVQDAGAPIPGAEVRITLIRVPAYHEPDEFTVVASHRLAADEDGYWEIELTPNAEFDPDNTFYRVVEANKVTHEILVEDWPYPVWLGDVLEPGGAPASLPTLHSGQFDAHGATSSATPDRIVRRDGDGRAQVADPAVAADIATRGWAEGEAAGQVAAHEAADPAHPAGNVSFSPSGLAIVTTDRVQDAIAELDAWADDAEGGALSAYALSADVGGSRTLLPIGGILTDTLVAFTTAGRHWGMPVHVPRRRTYRYMRLTVGTQSGNIRLAVAPVASIVDHREYTYGPLVMDSGTIACPAPGQVRVDLGAQELAPGLHTLLIECDNTTATFGGGTRFQDRAAGGLLYGAQRATSIVPGGAELLVTGSLWFALGLDEA